MKKVVAYLILVSYPIFAELTVSQIEDMVKRIQSKRVSEYDIDFLKIPSPLDGIAKVQEDNKTKTVLLDSVKEVKFTLNAIINKQAYINGKWYKRGDKIHRFVLREVFNNYVILRKDRKHIKVYLVKKRNINIKITGGARK
jgi:hypothetical protein